MKKIISILLLVFLNISSIGYAKEINVIIPNPPGSTTDILAKIVGDEYLKLTGDKFVIDYQPAASGTVAAVKFINSNKNTVLLGNSSLHVYNPVLEKNLPYNDNDFSYVAFVGYTPAIYISSMQSQIKNIDDLFKKLNNSQKPYIGGYAAAYNLSVQILKDHNKLDKKIEIVSYKGAPDIVHNVLNNSVEVGLVGTTGSLFQLAKEKKLHIIGTTHHEDITRNGVTATSLSKATGVPQTTGGFLFSVKPSADKTFSKEFSENIKKILENPLVQEQMLNVNIFPANVVGEEHTKDRVKKFRESIKKYAAK